MVWATTSPSRMNNESAPSLTLTLSERAVHSRKAASPLHQLVGVLEGGAGHLLPEQLRELLEPLVAPVDPVLAEHHALSGEVSLYIFFKGPLLGGLQVIFKDLPLAERLPRSSTPILLVLLSVKVYASRPLPNASAWSAANWTSDRGGWPVTSSTAAVFMSRAVSSELSSRK